MIFNPPVVPIPSIGGALKIVTAATSPAITRKETGSKAGKEADGGGDCKLQNENLKLKTCNWQFAIASPGPTSSIHSRLISSRALRSASRLKFT
jgi:hypothetical protein